ERWQPRELRQGERLRNFRHARELRRIQRQRRLAGRLRDPRQLGEPWPAERPLKGRLIQAPERSFSRKGRQSSRPFRVTRAGWEQRARWFVNSIEVIVW